MAAERRGADAVQEVIDQINQARTDLEAQETAWEKVNAAVQRYGFSIEEIGPALQRQNVDKQAQHLYEDFRLLTAAGISVDTVLGRMGDAINQFVQGALKTGTEIPAAMAPMLQRMVEMGALVGANGNVITDLEAAGVKFSMTMSEGFQALIGEVQKLTEAIARGLGLAIENIPDPHVTGTVDWHVEPIPNLDMPEINARMPEPIPMADGGDFVVRQPTLFMAGEAGAERATFTPLGRASSPSGSSGVVVNISGVTVMASENDDPLKVQAVFLEALRTKGPLYEAIGTVAQRAVA
jgi:hypothetical protein